MSPAAGGLRGRTAIITGGTRGIGLATVRRFAEEGANVVFCSRDQAEGRRVEERLGDRGAVAFVACDVTSSAQVEALVQAACERFGPPEILVNNAGMTPKLDAEQMSEDEWDAFFDIDLKSSWRCIKHCLPHMLARGSGAIVNVSSIHAWVSLEGYFPYAAAKAGLLGLTRSLALDYATRGIRVNAVAPGFTLTEGMRAFIDSHEEPAARERTMAAGVPVRRLARPDEIAGAIYFLASPDASYVTGSSLVVDGGLMTRRSGA